MLVWKGNIFLHLWYVKNTHFQIIKKFPHFHPNLKVLEVGDVIVGGENGISQILAMWREAVIKTSRTGKNPTCLFHCCPYGSENDKFHLFSWTNECMVEEIEYLKDMVTDVKGEISEMNLDFT
ncbi:unnamed protein product [Eruca vesicaria subsp. sativa]|uniref:Uncharacterized protein n=1 Tax=Eruca vesicaria subsp. sativa TaxID=29727 RepID=A0ABC8KFC1_ERUVS|nr:unnamed protein product [Eruca vesicaria subsp. sativa]